ncbi:MAG: tyrosine recombinase XerC [Phocaeicola sp.]|nr:tyrosine recombinase XerC [Phocaeicola sp.]MDD7447757.1 tyrosine recombinase XerC [Prevotellaceae bacterium]MDY5939463.1 tyrosine recombinase XerC [Phocaeicola sp.]
MWKDTFLKYLQYERNYSEKTILSYENDLSQFERFLSGIDEEQNLCIADSDLIRAWMVSLMEQSYTATSVNRKLSSLRSFYRFLLKRGEINADPTQKIVGPKKKKPLPVFVKEADMEKLLSPENFGEGFEDVRDRLILNLFYSTGMRLAELIGLDVQDVDFSLSTLKVTGKRNKQRFIPFGEDLKEDLQKYARLRSELPLSTTAWIVGKEGSRISRTAVYGIVRNNLSKVVSLKKRSPHVLRHTFATTMLNNNAELGAVKELLGHSTLAATEVYTHTTFEELKKIYEQAHPRA